jgi:hypothetical protein
MDRLFGGIASANQPSRTVIRGATSIVSDDEWDTDAHDTDDGR